MNQQEQQRIELAILVCAAAIEDGRIDGVLAEVKNLLRY